MCVIIVIGWWWEGTQTRLKVELNKYFWNPLIHSRLHTTYFRCSLHFVILYSTYFIYFSALCLQNWKKSTNINLHSQHRAALYVWAEWLMVWMTSSIKTFKPEKIIFIISLSWIVIFTCHLVWKQNLDLKRLFSINSAFKSGESLRVPFTSHFSVLHCCNAGAILWVKQ